MSGRKISHAELEERARKLLEQALAKTRQLGDEAGALIAMGEEACARMEQLQSRIALALEQGKQQELARDTKKFQEHTTAITRVLSEIMTYSRATSGRQQAAASASERRVQAEKILVELRSATETVCKTADRVEAELPAAERQQLYAEVEQLKADAKRRALQKQLRWRREWGELDRGAGDTGVEEKLSAGDVAGAQEALEQLKAASWNAEKRYQTMLETGDRLIGAVIEVLPKVDGERVIKVKERQISISQSTGSVVVTLDGEATLDLFVGANAAPHCNVEIFSVADKAGVKLHNVRTADGTRVVRKAHETTSELAERGRKEEAEKGTATAGNKQQLDGRGQRE